MRNGARRANWFENYLKTTLDRDLRDISDAQKLGEVPRLLKLLAGRAANLLNSSDVGKRLQLEHKTVRSYDEIDLVVEDRSGAIACLEVKAAATVRERDWRPMAKVRDARSKDFRAGFLIHAGAQTIPLGDRLWAVPISALWA